MNRPIEKYFNCTDIILLLCLQTCCYSGLRKQHKQKNMISLKFLFVQNV